MKLKLFSFLTFFVFSLNPCVYSLASQLKGAELDTCQEALIWRAQLVSKDQQQLIGSPSDVAEWIEGLSVNNSDLSMIARVSFHKDHLNPDDMSKLVSLAEDNGLFVEQKSMVITPTREQVAVSHFIAGERPELVVFSYYAIGKKPELMELLNRTSSIDNVVVDILSLGTDTNIPEIKMESESPARLPVSSDFFNSLKAALIEHTSESSGQYIRVPHAGILVAVPNGILQFYASTKSISVQQHLENLGSREIVRHKAETLNQQDWLPIIKTVASSQAYLVTKEHTLVGLEAFDQIEDHFVQLQSNNSFADFNEVTPDVSQALRDCAEDCSSVAKEEAVTTPSTQEPMPSVSTETLDKFLKGKDSGINALTKYFAKLVVNIRTRTDVIADRISDTLRDSPLGTEHDRAYQDHAPRPSDLHGWRYGGLRDGAERLYATFYHFALIWNKHLVSRGLAPIFDPEDIVDPEKLELLLDSLDLNPKRKSKATGRKKPVKPAKIRLPRESTLEKLVVGDNAGIMPMKLFFGGISRDIRLATDQIADKIKDNLSDEKRQRFIVSYEVYAPKKKDLNNARSMGTKTARARLYSTFFLFADTWNDILKDRGEEPLAVPKKIILRDNMKLLLDSMGLAPLSSKHAEPAKAVEPPVEQEQLENAYLEFDEQLDRASETLAALSKKITQQQYNETLDTIKSISSDYRQLNPDKIETDGLEFKASLDEVDDKLRQVMETLEAWQATYALNEENGSSPTKKATYASNLSDIFEQSMIPEPDKAYPVGEQYEKLIQDKIFSVSFHPIFVRDLAKKKPVEKTRAFELLKAIEKGMVASESTTGIKRSQGLPKGVVFVKRIGSSAPRDRAVACLMSGKLEVLGLLLNERKTSVERLRIIAKRACSK